MAELTPEQELAFAEITPLCEDDVQHLDFLRAELVRLTDELAHWKQEWKETEAYRAKTEEELDNSNRAVKRLINHTVCKSCPARIDCVTHDYTCDPLHKWAFREDEK